MNISTGPVPVPYTGNLPWTLTDGKEIIVDGVASPYGDRFNINLCVGPTNDTDTVLHFNPRFDQGEVVRTNKFGDWGPEEKQGGLPFYKGAPYEVKIVVRDFAFEIFVNNTFFCNFNHRMPKESARFLYVEGDTTINRIAFNDQRGGAGGMPVYSNPIVPFSGPIQGGIYPGRSIIINGVPNYGASRFNVNLMCGSYFESSDLALHFDVRFNYGNSNMEVVRTHRLGGEYGSEETYQSYFPFAHNVPFEMMIIAESYGFKILVNGQQFADFGHRIQPMQRISHIGINGDVMISQIRIQ